MMLARRVALAVAAAALATATVSAQRPPDPQSDLQGLWTNGTVTPLQRPDDFKDKPFLTPAEAAEYERTSIERLRSQIPDELDKKFAPDLDETFLETHTMKVVDGLRTSLIVDPADGKLPPQLPAAKERAAARPKQSYDDPETVGLDERCLLEVALGSSNAAPPMVPNVFGQDFYQFVQTRDYVMILTEVVHDARIIRIGGTHLPSSVQKWLGDSIGHWEGSTLVVDTTNFTPKSHFAGSGERLHVVERFSLQGPDTIRYRVTVEDPDTWATPWTAEIPFKRTSEQIYEYACHEGNRAVENYLRGARAEEQRAGTP
jgi:hypothetical protein